MNYWRILIISVRRLTNFVTFFVQPMDKCRNNYFSCDCGISWFFSGNLGTNLVIFFPRPTEEFCYFFLQLTDCWILWFVSCDQLTNFAICSCSRCWLTISHYFPHNKMTKFTIFFSVTDYKILSYFPNRFSNSTSSSCNSLVWFMIFPPFSDWKILPIFTRNRLINFKIFLKRAIDEFHDVFLMTDLIVLCFSLDQKRQPACSDIYKRFF